MSTTPPQTTIQCPKCGATLPPSRISCQFCGADTKGVVRPPGARAISGVRAAYTWKHVVLFVLAGMWILNGAGFIVSGLGAMHFPFFDNTVIRTAFVIIGAAEVLVGIGLFTGHDLARGIVNVLCWITIFFAGLSAIFSLFAMSFLIIIPLAEICICRISDLDTGRD